MTEGRGRTRTSAPAAGRTGGGRTGGGQPQQNEDWGRRGSAGMDTVRQERDAAAARRNRPFEPFRFFLPKNASTEITILDDSLADAWYMFEHAIPGPGMDWKKTSHEACPREFEECPICNKAQEDPKGRFGPSSYMTFLTIIENHPERPYRDRAGVDHYFGKRLLALKPGQLEDYERLFEVVKKNEGSLRGMTLIVERGPGDTSPRVGKPVINDQGQMYEMLTEDQLIEYYGNDEERDERGQITKALDENIHPFDYKTFFVKPSAEDIVTRWPQLAVGVGSQADIDRTLREGEDAPARGRGGSRAARPQGRPANEPTGTTGARGRGRAAPADYNEDPPEDPQQEQPAGRARGRTAAPATSQAADPPPRGRSAAAAQTRAAAPAQQQQARGRAAPATSGRGAVANGRTRTSSLAQDMDDDIPFK